MFRKLQIICFYLILHILHNYNWSPTHENRWTTYKEAVIVFSTFLAYHIHVRTLLLSSLYSSQAFWMQKIAHSFSSLLITCLSPKNRCSNYSYYCQQAILYTSLQLIFCGMVLLIHLALLSPRRSWLPFLNLADLNKCILSANFAFFSWKTSKHTAWSQIWILEGSLLLTLSCTCTLHSFSSCLPLASSHPGKLLSLSQFSFLNSLSSKCFLRDQINSVNVLCFTHITLSKKHLVAILIKLF